jgi:hypothetical protein
MIKSWKKFNEMNDMNGNFKPIGVNNMVEGIHGLVCIFTPLESDMIDGWNSDETIKKWVKEERVFLQEISSDEWSIWGIEGDREVENYINNNYSW